MGSSSAREVAEARAAELAAEFVAEPIIGWRAWRLDPREGGYLLRSLTQDGRPWPAREPLRAACLRGEAHGPAPALPCRCGIYAWRDPGSLEVGRWARGSVLGTVALWGRVVEHDRGYRAELAYPQRLRLVCARCLTEGFPSRAEVAGLFHATGWTSSLRHGELVALCELHAGPLVDDLLEPVPVERAVLAAYAVDLLPREAVRAADRELPSARGAPGPLRRLARRVLG